MPDWAGRVTTMTNSDENMGRQENPSEPARNSNGGDIQRGNQSPIIAEKSAAQVEQQEREWLFSLYFGEAENDGENHTDRKAQLPRRTR